LAVILENIPVGAGWKKVRLAWDGEKLRPGQFMMLKIPGMDPLLGRPISIFDWNEEEKTVDFLYQVVGRGTQIIADMAPGREIDLQGPYGNGFPLVDGDVTLIGGGVGIAPLYRLAKCLKEADPARHVRVHLGFRETALMKEAYESVADEVLINIGGFVTDDVDYTEDRILYTCGPTPMMEVAARKAREQGRTIYVSLENRMACGVGACLACSCKTIKGNKRVCKDGPVFEGQEVFYE